MGIIVRYTRNGKGVDRYGRHGQREREQREIAAERKVTRTRAKCGMAVENTMRIVTIMYDLLAGNEKWEGVAPPYGTFGMRLW